ncbi:MAG: nitrous oxide reductase accessory protein NosL [Planctomycetota bacterium]|jgi:copper chaperone NosL
MRAAEARLAVVALCAGVLLGCGGAAPQPVELVLDEEACSLCRMAVSQRPFAAEAVARTGRADFFDDIGCLARWSRERAVPAETGLFVVDHETGDWLEARRAHYVRADRLQTPMASGLAAFAARERAAAAARKLGGRVLDWVTVCAEEAP